MFHAPNSFGTRLKRWRDAKPTSRSVLHAMKRLDNISNSPRLHLACMTDCMVSSRQQAAYHYHFQGAAATAQEEEEKEKRNQKDYFYLFFAPILIEQRILSPKKTKTKSGFWGVETGLAEKRLQDTLEKKTDSFLGVELII